MKQQDKELYLVPEVFVVKIAPESVICVSNPGDVPDSIGGGDWI